MQRGLHPRLVAGLLRELEELEVGDHQVALPRGMGGVAVGEAFHHGMGGDVEATGGGEVRVRSEDLANQQALPCHLRRAVLSRHAGHQVREQDAAFPRLERGAVVVFGEVTSLMNEPLHRLHPRGIVAGLLGFVAQELGGEAVEAGLVPVAEDAGLGVGQQLGVVLPGEDAQPRERDGFRREVGGVVQDGEGGGLLLP